MKYIRLLLKVQLVFILNKINRTINLNMNKDTKGNCCHFMFYKPHFPQTSDWNLFLTQSTSEWTSNKHKWMTLAKRHWLVLGKRLNLYLVVEQEVWPGWLWLDLPSWRIAMRRAQGVVVVVVVVAAVWTEADSSLWPPVRWACLYFPEAV